MLFDKPIAISLSPNTEGQDVFKALEVIFKPWRWKSKKSVNIIENWFKQYLNCSQVVSFNSGRAALYSVLKAFDIGQNDEVLTQAFSCVAVANSISWTGAKPVFVDIDDSLNINHQLLEEKITRKTKAIIVQHTFGIPAKIIKIRKIANKHDLILIEDCAHSIGATVNGKKIGTFADAAIFSFGRDKVISSIFGGIAIINRRFKIENRKLTQFQKKLAYPSYFWIFQQLLHPIAFAIILPLYSSGIGKALLIVLQKLNLLSKAVFDQEKKGRKPSFFPSKYPGALASLLIPQLEKLEKYNNKRIEIAQTYFMNLRKFKQIKFPLKTQGATYLRFNILSKKGNNILFEAEKNNIYLGNWYKNTIDPKGVYFDKVNYTKGSCRKAEKAAELSVNLPTYPRLTDSQVRKIIAFIKKKHENNRNS